MVTKVDPKSISVDFGEIKDDRMKNFRDRIWSIKYWTQFMKLNSDEDWSEGQARLINAQFQSADDFYTRLEKTEKGREILERLKAERIK